MAGVAIAAEKQRVEERELSRPAPLLISLDLYDAEVTHVVRLLADLADRNVVIPDDVSGRVTLKLTQVEWGTALRVVLATRDLGVVEEGNVLRIAPRARLDLEERRYLAGLAETQGKRPLVTRVVQLNHARAVDLVPLVQATLSARGTVSVDVRTNTLVIRDVGAAEGASANEVAE